MTERERMLRRIQATQFALWELHVYRDTHPTCREAAAKYKDTEARLKERRAQYEEKYGPLDERTETGNRWAWIRNPWPWQLEEED